jgi:hypothetical protein
VELCPASLAPFNFFFLLSSRPFSVARGTTEEAAEVTPRSTPPCWHKANGGASFSTDEDDAGGGLSSSKDWLERQEGYGHHSEKERASSRAGRRLCIARSVARDFVIICQSLGFPPEEDTAQTTVIELFPCVTKVFSFPQIFRT